METADLIKKVRAVEIKTRGLSNHIFAGEYQAAFKGRGMSFSEVREYQYGDDIRSIDWNVTARQGSPYVKQFEEERELTLMLVIDVSASANFGSQYQYKTETLIELSATLAFAAINNNDKVGLLLFTDRVELFIPPKKGKRHILRLIREIIDFKPKGHRTDIRLSLEYLNRILKKRGIVFLMSDFISAEFGKQLQSTARRHDLVGMHIVDPAEKRLPNVGLARLYDPETQTAEWINTSSKKVRHHFNHFFQQQEAQVRSAFQKAGADFISFSTSESFVKTLKTFFHKREKRR